MCFICVQKKTGSDVTAETAPLNMTDIFRLPQDSASVRCFSDWQLDVFVETDSYKWCLHRFHWLMILLVLRLFLLKSKACFSHFWGKWGGAGDRPQCLTQARWTLTTTELPHPRQALYKAFFIRPMSKVLWDRRQFNNCICGLAWWCVPIFSG